MLEDDGCDFQVLQHGLDHSEPGSVHEEFEDVEVGVAEKVCNLLETNEKDCLQEPPRDCRHLVG